MKKTKKYIAAYGEHTNHKHVMESLTKNAFMNIMKEAENAVIEIMNGEVGLTHEEHNPILFLVDTKYIQYQMREVDPFENEIRLVRD